MKLKTKLIEKAFKRKVIPFVSAMGIDTASRTGWCKATTDPNYVTFDYNFIHVKTRDKYSKYNQYIDIFSAFPMADKIIIEEAFLKFFRGKGAVKGFQLLSRIGMTAYTSFYLRGKRDSEFMLASTARKNLGFLGNAKKELIHKQFKKLLKIKIDDEDIIDAMILAINGILEEKI